MDRVSKAERELVRKIQKQTNADRLRAMTDEELAEFLQEPHCNRITNDDCKYKFCGDCTACWLDWLRQEAAE